MRLSGAGTILILAALAVGCGGGGGGNGKPKSKNQAPQISRPTGPGIVNGSDPSYTTALTVGDPLVFSVTVTDGNPTDSLTFTANAMGGTLTPAQAGFNETFPAVSVGPSPQVLTFTGTAQFSGDIQISFTADDGNGGTDLVNLTITIESFPSLGAPVATWPVNGSDPNYNGTVSLTDPIGFSVQATDPDSGDVLSMIANVTGGTLSAAQAGFNESFPHTNAPGGFSPQTLVFTGAAGAAGDIQITIDVNDGTGGTDSITLTLFIVSGNLPPQIQQPGGPGTVSGADPAYSTQIEVGQPLDFDTVVLDPNPGNNLTFSANVSGGSLTGADAGFNETFPHIVGGNSPQTISLTGTAAMAGDIVISFGCIDGAGGADTITHVITINSPPRIDPPTQPGSVSGSHPNYASDVILANSLIFTITATDGDATDTLTLTATRTGGSLTEADAGFNETLPITVQGTSPQSITLSGTALNLGDIEITFDVDDGRGSTDRIVYLITIDAFGPEVTGLAFYTDEDVNAAAGPGDQVRVRFDQDITVGGGANASSFVLPVTGDTFGAGATVAPGPGSDEMTITLGTAPNLTTRFTFDPANTQPGDPSGIDISPTITPGAITSTFSGVDAVPSTPIDILPAFVQDSTVLITTFDLGTSVDLGDLDGDLDLDAVAGILNFEDPVYTNDGTGAFTNVGDLDTQTYETTHVRIGNIDGDADLDVILGTPTNTRVYTNNGSAVFTNTAQALGPYPTRDLQLGDVDGDLDLDIVDGIDGLQDNRVWTNNGSGTFTDSGQLFGERETQAIALGDVDGVNGIDVVTANGPLATGSKVFLNNGSGVFSDSGQDLGTGSDSASIALADVDGDFDLDIIAGNGNTSAEGNRIYINDGAGVFTDSGQSLGSARTLGLAVWDFDGDGDIDFIAVNSTATPNFLWLNDGSGVFTDSGLRMRQDSDISTVIGDVDGDGDVDYIAVSPDVFRVWKSSLAGT